MTSRRRQPEPTDDWPHGRIGVRLDELLEARQMTMTELAERVDITLANMSILKNGHARAVRFSTLTAICHVLDCQPGDILSWEPPGL